MTELSPARYQTGILIRRGIVIIVAVIIINIVDINHMLPYPFTMVFHRKFKKKKKKDIPVYAGRKLILRRDLNVRR